MSIRQVRIGVARRQFFAALEAERLSASTLKQKRISLDALERAAVADGIVYVRDLEKAHFDVALTDLARGETAEQAEARRGRRGAPRSGRNPQTVAIDRRNMRQFVEFCKSNHWMAYNRNPLARLTKSTRPQGDNLDKSVKQKPIVEPHDWLRLLEIADAIHPRTRILVALGLFSGRRVSEITLMQWEHIKLSEREMKVHNQKRGRWRTIFFENMLAAELGLWRKRVTERYGVPQSTWYIVPPLMPMMEIWRSHIYTPNHDDRRLWPICVDRQATVIPLIKEVQRCLSELGWATVEREGVHTLRRSLASHLDSIGKIDVAQALLDHEKRSTTEIYTGNRAGVRELKRLMSDNDGDPYGLETPIHLPDLGKLKPAN